MRYLYHDIKFDKNVPKLAGYTSKLRKLKCEIVGAADKDEVFIRVKKSKHFPRAMTIRVLRTEVVDN